MFKKLVLCLSLGSCLLSLAAQAQTGLYPYGSFDSLGFDTIDRGSLNAHFAIPVVNKAGRGIGFSYQLVYDSLVWSPQNSSGVATWTPTPGFGLHGEFNDGLIGYTSYFQRSIKCYPPGGGSFYWDYIDQNYVYHDPFGVSHAFAYTYNDCTGTTTGTGAATDGSGFSFNGSVVTSPDGKAINAPFNSQTSNGSVTDSNGNYVTNHGDGTFTDTLGKTALTITGSGTAASPRYFQYSTPTGTASVTVSYKTYTVQTVFGCAATEYNLSQDLVDKISLADGSVYQFVYELTPGHSPNVTGRLAQLILPQGGTIQYQYTGANNGIICADGTPAGLTRTGGVTRTYVRSSVTAATSHTDITDGLSNVSNFDFVMSGSPEAFYETNRTVHQGSSTILLSRQTCYNNSGSTCTTTAITPPIAQIDTYETLNGSQQHGSTLTYNTFGLLTSRTDYDFNGTSRSPAPMRKETWVWPTSGIVNLVSSDTVTDGTNQIGSTTYAYDETSGAGHGALITTSVPQHTSAGQRGNPTTVTQSFSPTGSLTVAGIYEDTGNPVSSTTPSGVSTYAYDPATHAFTITATPPTPNSGVSLPSSATYDANSGLQLTAVDPNNQSVTYKSYDPLFRPTEIDYPDGGVTVASYSPNQTGVYRYMTSSTHTNTQTNFDSYGRLNWVAVQNSSGGYYWNNYCYDGNGNLQFAAYRFASGSIVCSGAGDTYTYDALGRVKTITHADSSVITYNYYGRATQITDENGVSRIIQVDGLGRPTVVCELSSAPLNGVYPAACGLDISGSGFKTTYAYSTDTALGNALETKVMQGVQIRIFETDWLGRKVKVVQPESGTTSYSYSYNSAGLIVTRIRPQANQTGSTTTTTTTQYDSIGRVISVGYTDGTPNKGFAYDANNYWPETVTNLKGRLVATSSGAGSTFTGSLWSYDAMGRVVNTWACGPATCGNGYQSARPLSFAYDWVGNLTQEFDNVTGTINFGRSIAGEITSITNASYQNLPYNPPNLASNVVNGPDGPVSYTLGNGLNVYRSYDALGRWQGQWVCNGPAAVNCSGGTQIYGTKGVWQGSQMQSQADTVLGQQILYGYDGFNRLTSRTVTAGTAQNYTYSYDIYGNRVSQTALQSGYNFNPLINPNTNQITTSGFTYDSAGNMTNDTVHSYTYDAEANITAMDGGSTAQYVYDAFNRRVHVQTSSGTTEYTYDYAGRRISSWLSPNNTGNEGRIYWDGQQFGYRSSDGTTYYDHQDTLGTERMRTDFGAGPGASFVSLPWGDGYTATTYLSGGIQDNNHFAGLERDAESGTEHAQFRNYASVQGRWLAPDSYLGSYDLTNPQSMNRYAYVLNNPLSFVDPSGLDTSQPVPCVDSNGNSVDDNGNAIFCMTTVNGPSNPAGCVSWGTQGCIQWPCWMVWGCGSQPAGPPSGGAPSSGGGGATAQLLGPPRIAILSAPNNVQQETQQCVSSFYNSLAGKAVQFGSPLSLLPVWNPQWGNNLSEWGIAIVGKLGGLFGSGATPGTNQLTTLSGTKTVGSAPELATEGALGAIEKFATPAMALATAADIMAHGTCAMMADPAAANAALQSVP